MITRFRQISNRYLASFYNHIEFEILSKDTVAIDVMPKNKTKWLSIMSEFNAEEEENGKELNWVIKRDRLKQFIKTIKNQEEQYYIKHIPKFISILEAGYGDTLIWKDEYQVEKKIVYDECRNHLNEEINKNLFPFQRECVRRAMELNGRLLIADEMGIGKTVESLAIASLYPDDWPMLVICPSLLKFNWRDEIMKWLKIPEEEIQIIQKSSQEVTKTKVIIISYQLVTKLENVLQMMNFKLAICDEVHYLKGLDSQRSLACVPLLQQCKRLMLLTGTPAYAKPKDMFNQLKILRPDVFQSFSAYGKRYCDPKRDYFIKVMTYDGLTHAAELNYMLNNYFMIRRLKSDVLSELPSKRTFKIKVETDSKWRKEIQEIMAHLGIDRILNFFSGKVKWSHQDKLQYLELYQLSGISKVKSLIEYLDNLITRQGQKVICFAHHKQVIMQIDEYFTKKNVKHIRIDGSIKNDERHQSVHEFQTNDEIRFAILGLTAAGVGITLTASSIVVFGEMHWTPANMLQAEDRVHRIGQTNSVEIHYLIGNGTIDELIYRKLESKMNTVSTFLDGQSSGLYAEQLNAEIQVADWSELSEFDIDLNTTQIDPTVIDDVDQILVEGHEPLAKIEKASKESKSKSKSTKRKKKQ